MSKQQILSSAKIITLALVVALGVRSIAAFSNPPGAPPACPTGYPGCDAPLNAGPTAQSKAGALTVNASSSGQYPTGLYVFGQTVLDNSALATSAVKIVDGSQHAGYVLTSDGNGNATWSAPTGGSGGGGMSVVTGTARSSDGTTTITLPAGTWNLTVFMGYPNCVDKSITLKFDGTTIGTRTGFGDQQGCNDSTISGTASSVAGGSHKLSIIGFDPSVVIGQAQQFWYWTATSGSAGTASTGKVYWEEDFDPNVGESQLYCNSVTGTGYCNTSAQNEVSMGCTDGNILQDYVISSAKKSFEWTAVKHVGYCVGAPN